MLSSRRWNTSYALSEQEPGMIFDIGGALNVVYDLTLWRLVSHVPLPEEHGKR